MTVKLIIIAAALAVAVTLRHLGRALDWERPGVGVEL